MSAGASILGGMTHVASLKFQGEKKSLEMVYNVMPRSRGCVMNLGGWTPLHVSVVIRQTIRSTMHNIAFGRLEIDPESSARLACTLTARPYHPLK
jgi:hypothetical protein